MAEPIQTPVTQALEAAGVPFAVRPHSRPVFTTEEAAEERGVRVSQIVKVMLAVDNQGRLLAVLIPGHRRLDLARLRQSLGDPSVRLLPAEQIAGRTGLTVGAISPVGIQRWAQVLVDEEILEEEFVAISAGVPEAGLLLRTEDLLRIVPGTLGRFSQRAP